MRKTVSLSLLFLLTACVLNSHAQQDKKGDSKNAALERFAKLEGEWAGKGLHGGTEQDIRVTYKVTAGGSAVIETIAPGTSHEMITVIHADGDALALTHYCMLGNQPQMRATPKAGDKSVAFKFVKATNLKSDNDMCMRNATFTFVDNDTLKSEWSLFQDGKELDKAVFELKRKK